MRIVLPLVALAALFVAGCQSYVGKQGSNLLVGESAEKAQAVVRDAQARGEVPKGSDGSDWLSLAAQILGIGAAGTGGLFGARALVRKTINTAPWTPEEKADIKAIAAAPAEPPKATDSPKV